MKKAILSLLSLALLSGCAIEFERDDAGGETQRRLHNWAEVISMLAQTGVKVQEYESIESIYLKYQNTGYFIDYDRKRMRLDYWGRPWVWAVNSDADKTTIFIGSCGRNGVWEGGGNDDLYVTVEIPASGGEPAIHQQPAASRGFFPKFH